MVSMLPMRIERMPAVSRQSYRNSIRFLPVVSRKGANAVAGGGVSYQRLHWQ
jgi:hypothetical protein